MSLRPRFSLPLLVSVLLVGVAPAACAVGQARGSGDVRRAPAALLFKSRRAVARRLGKEAAAAIPAGFDFRARALVWVAQPHEAHARVVVTPLLADGRPLRLPASEGAMEVWRKGSVVRVVIHEDSMPCTFGMPQPREVEKACYERVEKEQAELRRTLRLLSTPRRGLRRVVVKRKEVPPRP